MSSDWSQHRYLNRLKSPIRETFCLQNNDVFKLIKD